MQYSQKYCLVSFLQSVPMGMEFNMLDWPLHVTLVGVFAIDRKSTKIETKLAELLSVQPTINTSVDREAILGNAEVVLLDKTEGLIKLHMSLVDLLEKNGADLNSPEFTKEGFLPHCTIQRSMRLSAGDGVEISTIALIDMFPDQNWQQRKIIKVFKLQTSAQDR